VTQQVTTLSANDDTATSPILAAPVTTPTNPNPAALLQQAMSQGATPDILDRLMDAQERWEARQARKEFDAAISLARQEIPNIYKAKQGHGYKYAGLDDIAKTIIPILSKYGLSYRWKTDNEGANIKVTCLLSHRSGHEETTSLVAPQGSVGTKLQNPIQAMGSAITYLQRYTLTAALGLVSSLDDDGAATTQDTMPITTEQRDHILNLINAHDINIERFCTYLGVANVAALLASDYQKALTSINRSIAARKQAQQQAEQQQAAGEMQDV